MPGKVHQRIRRRRRSKGYSLVELLTVVLILLILLDVSLPLYLSTIADAQKKTCRSNMQTIADAVQAARVKNIFADYSTFQAGGGAVTTAKEPDLLTIPVCPKGGTYTVTTGSSGDAKTFQVNCSFAGTPTHGKYEPGVDSQ